jgi:hypothetical protein
VPTGMRAHPSPGPPPLRRRRAPPTPVSTCTRTPFQTFSPERLMARYAITSLHGRYLFLGRFVPRRVAPLPTRRSLTQPPRPPALLNPKKGVWTPTQVGDHLGLTIDLRLGMFLAPPAKLHQLAQQAPSLLGRAASNARWLPTRQLAAFAGKSQFLYLAIAPAHFFLREMHNVLATRTG